MAKKGEKKEIKEFKLSDTYFKFPIRITNENDVKRILQKEEEQEATGVMGEITALPYAIGYARIPFKLAQHLQWSDGFSRHRSIDEVDKEGFDYTNVVTPDGDVFICAYKREKFESVYFGYIDKVDKYFSDPEQEEEDVEEEEDVKENKEKEVKSGKG